MTSSDGQGGGRTILGTGQHIAVPAASTQPPTSEDPIVGKELAGRYHIERKVGEGGMGAVYIGRHMKLDKTVAVKVLHPEYARKPDLVERFLQEAKAASKIRHENVIDITDFGVGDEGTVFFCMEFLAGQDLHELITRAKLDGKRIPWVRAAPIFLQICGALAAAHKAGVIHRDLKPENIFLIEWLGNPDFVKLLDFGIAKMTEVNEDGRKLTKTGMLFGTPEYMSPEQARGEHPDHRVDVYAMGCILFQLVTSDVPFAGESFMAVLSQHLTASPPVVGPEALAAVGAPAALSQVIAKALEKDRDQRYGTMNELADAVRAVSGGEVVSAEVEASRTRSGWRGSVAMPVAPSDPAPVQPNPPPRRTALIVGSFVAAVVAIAALAFVLSRGGASDNAETENAENAENENDPTEVPTADPTGETQATDRGDSPTEPVRADTTVPADPANVDPPAVGTTDPVVETTEKPPGDEPRDARVKVPTDKPDDPPADDPSVVKPPKDPAIKAGEVKTKDPFDTSGSP